MEKIPNEILDQWHQCGTNPELNLPKPNLLIDNSPKIVPVDPQREDAMPELFLNMERVRIRAWHMPFTKLKIPKSFSFMRFLYTESQSAKVSCLCSLLAFVVRDCLSEESYEGQLAGLFYSLRPLKDGLELEVRGFSGNQDLFLNKILKVIFQSGWDQVLTEERFNQVQTLHRNGLVSGDASKLKIQAKTILSHVLNPSHHLRESRLEALCQLTLDDLKHFAKDFLLKHHLDCFFYGNVTIESANKMTDLVVEARKEFLEQYAKDLEIQSADEQLVLEDWFRNDPIHRIITLEDSIGSKIKELEEAEKVRIQEKLYEEENHNAEDLEGDHEPLTNGLMANHLDEKSEVLNPISMSVNNHVHKMPNNVSVIHHHHAPKSPKVQSSPMMGSRTPAPPLTSSHTPRGGATPIPPPSPDANNVGDLANEDEDDEANEIETEYSVPQAEHPDARNVVIVHNEIQSSSCVLYYLESATNNPKDAATVELFFHLVQVQLVTALKHVVHLGYVVGCDIRKIKDRLGFRIIVESQYPLSIVHKTIEDSLEDLDDFLAHMDENDFEMSKAAVISVKEDSRTSLRDQAHSLWREIIEEQYDFNRHKKELAFMSELDLFDVRSFYRTWFHSKARDRRNLIISISPDPTLNRLESKPQIQHWRLNQLKELRQTMTPLPIRTVPLDWFQNVFENRSNIYEPPFKNPSSF